MSVYTLRAIRATPEPTIESFFYSLQEILADLKEKYALFLAAYNACYCGYVTLLTQPFKYIRRVFPPYSPRIIMAPMKSIKFDKKNQDIYP